MGRRKQALVSIEISEQEGICTVLLNRPHAHNSLNAEALSELDTALEEIARDGGIAVVVFAGAGGRAFCAGADVGEMKDKTPGEAQLLSRTGQAVLQKIQDLPQPTIAAISGVALGGGCELALACDIRLAAAGSRFGQPEVGFGVIPGWGGTQRLPRLVGSSVALEMILSGRTLSAQEAAAVGLVNKVVADEELWDEVQQLAHTISSRGAEVVYRVKQAVKGGMAVSLDDGCELETSLFGLCFGAQQREKMSAFLEKKSAAS